MKHVLTVLCIFIGLSSIAQESAEEKAIMKPVELLFKAMHLGDSAMARKAFTAHPEITTVMTGKDGNTVLRPDNFLKFMDAIGTPHAEPWNETVWGVEIRAADNLAMVWMKYAFYVGRKFSHCGVDAFQLVRDTSGEWLIFSVADTRKTTGCQVPREIEKQIQGKQ